MRLEEVDLAEWEAALPASGYEVFHTAPALGVLADHAEADLRLYVAYKGQEPVGMVPVFESSNLLGRVVASPWPSMGVPRLGPLVMPASPKQRKREADTEEFTDLVLDAVGADARRALVRFECPLGYADPRPFRWAGLDVDQRFTYVLAIDGREHEEVWNALSSDRRNEIRRNEDNGVTVSIEGVDAALRVREDVAERYAEQDEPFGLSPSFFRDLHEALGERCRTYVARDPDGTYLGGIVALYSPEHASFWQGGVRASYEGVSVNSLLHWRLVEDALQGEPLPVEGYDLVGANTPRLCRYKAKFGASLVPYYVVESRGLEMSMAKRVYSLVDR